MNTILPLPIEKVIQKRTRMKRQTFLCLNGFLWSYLLARKCPSYSDYEDLSVLILISNYEIYKIIYKWIPGAIDIYLASAKVYQEYLDSNVYKWIHSNTSFPLLSTIVTSLVVKELEVCFFIIMVKYVTKGKAHGSNMPEHQGILLKTIISGYVIHSQMLITCSPS